jgi:hypothetical protein
MTVLGDGRIRCRVKITGTFRGRVWEYVDPEDSEGSQFIWPEDEDGNVDPSQFWWSEGNMGCDCNRRSFLPDEMKDEIGEIQCGDLIKIDEIIPVERGPNGEELPSLELWES